MTCEELLKENEKLKKENEELTKKLSDMEKLVTILDYRNGELWGALTRTISKNSSFVRCAPRYYRKRNITTHIDKLVKKIETATRDAIDVINYTGTVDSHRIAQAYELDVF